MAKVPDKETQFLGEFVYWNAPGFRTYWSKLAEKDGKEMSKYIKIKAPGLIYLRRKNLNALIKSWKSSGHAEAAKDAEKIIKKYEKRAFT